MAGFPADGTKLEVGIAYGADISADPAAMTYTTITGSARPEAVIVRGRIDDSSLTQPSAVTLGLNNQGGTYSPRNIAGTHYGQLRRNTPTRVRLDPGSGYVTRGMGYIPSLSPTWGGPNIDDKIRTEAAGWLARLSQGQDTKSALRRTVMSHSPVAYWPLEDVLGAFYGASASGGTALGIQSGTVDFGSVLDLPGTTVAPDMSAGFLSGAFSGVNANSWHMQFAVKPGSGTSGMARVYTLGQMLSVYHIFIPNTAASAVQVFIDDPAAVGPTLGLSYTTPSDWPDKWHHVAFDVNLNAGNLDARLFVDGTLRDSTTGGPAFVAPPQMVYLNHNLPDHCASFAHVHFGNGLLWSGFYDAQRGYDGELAATRFARLCGEEGIVDDVSAGSSEPMGVQAPATILDLLRECEASDEAVMLERRAGQVGFNPRSNRYNQAAALTLNYEQGHTADLTLLDDDRDLRNQVTVSRVGGTAFTARRLDGPLSVDLVAGAGPKPIEQTRSLHLDSQVTHHATWLVNLGTIDEPRYVVTLDLRANPGLVTQWLACDIGSRIVVSQPPAIHAGAAPLDLIIEGYIETLDAVQWRVVLYTQPYRPYEVLQIGTGTGNRSRIPAPQATSASWTTTNVLRSPTDTSIAVTSTGVRWIDSGTYGSQFPFLCVIAGEVVNVTAISGTGLGQTFTVTRGVHGVAKTLPAGSLVQLWRYPVIAL